MSSYVKMCGAMATECRLSIGKSINRTVSGFVNMVVDGRISFVGSTLTGSLLKTFSSLLEPSQVTPKPG